MLGTAVVPVICGSVPGRLFGTVLPVMYSSVPGRLFGTVLPVMYSSVPGRLFGTVLPVMYSSVPGRLSGTALPAMCSIVPARLLHLTRICSSAPYSCLIAAKSQKPWKPKLSCTLNMDMRHKTTDTGSKENKNSGKELDVQRESPYAGLTMGEKVKEAGKDVSYIGVIVLGIGVTGAMLYYLGRELFSSETPNGVYKKAFKLCKNNNEVIDNIGEPIKGYGERTTRGRRRYVSHVEYLVDGVEHMRVQFYVEGPLRKGTAQVEVYKDGSGKFQFRYLFVELDGYPRKTLILEDNR